MNGCLAKWLESPSASVDAQWKGLSQKDVTRQVPFVSALNFNLFSVVHRVLLPNLPVIARTAYRPVWIDFIAAPKLSQVAWCCMKLRFRFHRSGGKQGTMTEAEK
jgi:hypothetical protein